MRAIVVRSIGGPDVLRLEEIDPPAPGAGEVLIETRAIGVNFADTERRRGVYAAPVLPWIPGREGAGVIVAVGDGVDAARVGARVAYFDPRASGAYAELVTVPASALFRFDDAIAPVDFGEMAALPLQGLTAHGVLRLAAIRPGQIVVVLAAAGGVGQILVQLARHAGARVIAIVSSAAKAAAVAALGAEVIAPADVIDGYDAFDGAVRARTGGRGADVVLDSIGRATAAASLASLAPFGQLVYYGDSSGLPPPIDVDALYGRSLRVGAFGLDIDRDAAAFARARDELIAHLAAGHLRLTVSRTFPLADAAAAHVEMEARRTVGKIVLLP